MENCINLLCSHQKLERDRGVAFVEKYLSEHEVEESVSLYKKLVDLLTEDKSTPWETFHGALIGLKCLLEKGQFANDLTSSYFSIVQNCCLNLLKNDEARVRLAAGELFGAMCRKLGVEVYLNSKDLVIEMIKENIEREIPAMIDSENLQDADNPLYKLRRSSSSEIFHDTAGWKFLETSMKCLQFMVDGCGRKFERLVNQELLDLIFVTLKHSNRFVRETGFQMFGSLFSCTHDSNPGSENGSDFISTYGKQFSHHLGLGLADNWSQVRLAASEAVRKFLLNISPEERDKFYDNLLPKMCLNRYYVAEGVRLYSQESWKLITGIEGKEKVEKFIDPVVEFYISQTKADNHAVREAACACIAELGLKIDHKTVEKHVPDLLEALIICFQDDSWPVRDASCLACGNFVLCFPEQSRSSMEKLYKLFFENLYDNIASVRQGAAVALANVVKAYGEESIPIMRNKIIAGFNEVKNQPAESYKVSESSAQNLSQFGVIKLLRDNDESLHTNQPMFSCGSLAPKMARGGGCMDHKFRRPSEPWELADGCINLISELSTVDCARSLICDTFPLMIEACSHKHYTHHVFLLETLCKQVPNISKGLGKRSFKQYLEPLFDPIFYSLQVDNSLANVAAENCLNSLSIFLGPNILRGRIENYNVSNVMLYDQIIR